MIEARNEAETILQATTRTLGDQLAQQLSGGERRAITETEASLREAMRSTDYKLIRQRVDELNQATMHLAEILMNSTLQAALQGKRLDDV